MACAFHATQGKCIYSRFIPSWCAPCNVLEGWYIIAISVLMSHDAVDMAPGTMLAPTPNLVQWQQTGPLPLLHHLVPIACYFATTSFFLPKVEQKWRNSESTVSAPAKCLLVAERTWPGCGVHCTCIFCRCLTWLQPVAALGSFMSFSQRLGIFRLHVDPYHPTLTKPVKYFIQVFSFEQFQLKMLSWRPS